MKKIKTVWDIRGLANGFVVEFEDSTLKTLLFDPSNQLTPYAGPHPEKIGGKPIADNMLRAMGIPNQL